MLDTIDLGARLSRDEYETRLAALKLRMRTLHFQMYDERVPALAVFEGWDAAGKGGAIRRVARAVDARLFQTISVAAPTDEERAHHYLWRFWRHLPRAGFMTF